MYNATVKETCYDSHVFRFHLAVFCNVIRKSNTVLFNFSKISKILFFNNLVGEEIKCRPISDLNIIKITKFKTSNYVRKFNNNIRKIHDLVLSGSVTKRLYWFSCRIFDRNSSNDVA